MIEIENKSKKYHNGSRWESKMYGEYEIIGKFKRDENEFYVCKFNDGTLVETYYANLLAKRLKNPNKITLYGIGFIGQGKWKSSKNNKHTKEYSLWSSIFYRCYSEYYHNLQPTYIDCSIDKRWHNFQNFCEDIKKLENYNEWYNDNKKYGKWQFDKDIKIKGNKIYSKDTCIFATKKDNNARNNKVQTITGLIYIGTRIKDGYKEKFTNISEFSEKYNLNRGNVTSCIYKRRNINKGWVFEIYKEVK